MKIFFQFVFPARRPSAAPRRRRRCLLCLAPEPLPVDHPRAPAPSPSLSPMPYLPPTPLPRRHYPRPCRRHTGPYPAPEPLPEAPADIAKLIAVLEKDMRAAARDLEFERAADLRDRIRALRDRLYVSGE